MCLRWFAFLSFPFSAFLPGSSQAHSWNTVLQCKGAPFTSNYQPSITPQIAQGQALLCPVCPFASPYSFMPFSGLWSLLQLRWVHSELHTWSWSVTAVCEHCCCCDACRLLLAVPWVAQPAATSPHNATFTHALTLPCLQERTGRPCLNRMHLVCLPAQGQGQLATWLLCQSRLTYGCACHCYNKRSVVVLCVQEKGHILSECLQYVPLDSLCSWTAMDGGAQKIIHPSRISCTVCSIVYYLQMQNYFHWMLSGWQRSSTVFFPCMFEWNSHTRPSVVLQTHQ